jgi:hypothetical protein
MSLSRRSIQTLIDLVENKLSNIQVVDREDSREVAILEAARRELSLMAGLRRAEAAAVAAIEEGRFSREQPHVAAA